MLPLTKFVQHPILQSKMNTHVMRARAAKILSRDDCRFYFSKVNFASNGGLGKGDCLSNVSLGRFECERSPPPHTLLRHSQRPLNVEWSRLVELSQQ
jgi:hypothetical protein